jgi:3-methylcrotonyl-CoA carboxylase alpha subunit
VGAGTVEFIVEQPDGYGLAGADGGFAAGPPQGETAPSGGSEPRAAGSVGASEPPPGRPEAASAPSGGSEPRAAGSVGAKFYFMEMNTRLQVEHPVTEAITGLDLVEWQLRVASGEPLPLAQDELELQGHAIEARICAENPDNNFLPATGALHVYRKPPASSFEIDDTRIDDGVREGDAITPFYDSMIAKLIVWGSTRQEALGRLDAALSEVRIVGVQTNVQFLRRVLATPSFAQARLDTALIQRESARLFKQDPIGLDMAAACAMARTVLAERDAESHDPFSRTDGFRSHGVASRRIDLEYAGQPVVAKLRYLHDGLLLKVGDGEAAPLAIARQSDGRIDVRHGQRRQVVQIFARGEVLHIFGAAGATAITELDVLSHSGEGASEGGRLTAPMPGKVVSIAVKAGDKVSKGQALAVMEAMKMEHTIAAPQDGTVEELLYAPGDQVAEGAELLRLGA